MTTVLLNTSKNFEVLSIDDKSGKVKIHDPFLQKLMEKGIDIPAFLRDSYNDQNKIKLNDKLFLKAFKEIYFENNMDHQIYKWMERK